MGEETSSFPDSTNTVVHDYVNIKSLPLFQDRENPDVVQSNFQDIPFQASFASGRQELSPVLDMPGVDGFVFNVDPLYKVSLTISLFKML